MSNDDLPPGEDYRGPIGGMKDSPFLDAGCFPEAGPGRSADILIEIERVRLRRGFDLYRGGRKVRQNLGGFLKFKGREKELLLNATNTNTLKRLFGRETGAWWGKKIILFIDRIPPPGGREPDGDDGKIGAIRIRNRNVNESNGNGHATPAPAQVASTEPPPAELGARPDVEWDGPKADPARDAGQD